MPTERNQICTLCLVHPPISNQEAEWLREDGGLQATLRESNLYMIGRRAEAKLSILNLDQITNTILLEISLGGDKRDCVELRIDELVGVASERVGQTEIEFGPKFLRIWAADRNGNRIDKLLTWFTTEKLLFDSWRGAPGITGPARIRDLSTYELLYAGISKKNDAFERLLNKPHDQRLGILANERQISANARVTDETYLFFFKTSVLRIHTYDHQTNFLEEDMSPDLDDSRIVADAEKAFVSFIKSRYNRIQYKQYPRGKDGLFDSELRRYCYAINEDLTFVGPGATIVGAFEPNLPVSNDADAIFVEGERAYLVKAEDISSFAWVSSRPGGSPA